MSNFQIVALLVGIALLFDFLNGMNDAANSIATVVATRVLSPRWAVAWAAFFNFAAAFLFGVGVAKTIGKGIVAPEVVTNRLIFAALVGAILWVALCTRAGLPISVSHSLIGGLVGAALVSAGPDALLAPKLIATVLFIFLAPMLGMLFGWLLMLATFWVFRRRTPRQVDVLFRGLQLGSAALYSLSHGANDAQKTMGIITALLFANGYLTGEFRVPLWVILSCHGVIALGTLLGGWKVVKTMGVKVTRLRPVGGFCAETGAGVCIVACSLLGIPVSTTHTVTGSIMGVGATVRLSAVRWGVAGRIIWAWVLTIPCSAATAGLVWLLASLAG